MLVKEQSFILRILGSSWFQKHHQGKDLEIEENILFHQQNTAILSQSSADLAKAPGGAETLHGLQLASGLAEARECQGYGASRGSWCNRQKSDKHMGNQP